ncbi:uncharacterized protein ATC70_003957 [Mucor velutinosus]|uniref:Uncharacterized protein n=1 Tax=Mucor velutinosus TaxID=708070 RepID=A0AAN7HXG3_9FUNG|nr:hypothetical protein ATC70_003957 [Mucor velutinosus]
MNPHALVIGDVDNDNENEFVIGNLNGDLAIFKGQCEDGFPSYVCRGLGTITCIAIGDVRNHGKNSVVIINAEGHAHIFDIPPKSKSSSSSADQQHISVDDYLRGGRRTSDTASIQAFRRVMSSNTMTSAPDVPPQQQQQFHQQQFNTNAHQQHQQQKPRIHDLGKPNLTLKVPVNVNKILIADIDHDDLNELILARTDRILHAFQLVPSDFTVPHDHVYKGIQTPSLASLSPSASTASLNGLGPHAHKPSAPQQQPPPQNRATSNTTSATTATAISTSTTTAAMTGAAATATSATIKDENNSKKINLLDKNMWVFDGQISSLCTTTHPERPNEPLLLVAQPGNTFTIIDQDGNRFNRDFTPQNSNNTAYNAKHSSSAKRSASNSTVGTSASASTATAPKEDEEKIKALLNSQTDGSLPYNFEIFQDPSLNQSAPSDDSDTHFQRSNYVVKNWPVLDGGGNNNDDVIDDEIESGAVATEIVIGKRHLLQDSFSSSEVGMLSMDGKFSIYDLKTKTTSQRDLFVTHKLFSLATLDVSAASSRLSNTSTATDSFAPHYAHSQQRYHHGTHTPVSSTSHLRFASTTTPKNGSLHEGSRSSSKLSLSGFVNSKKQQTRHQHDTEASNDEEDENGDEDEDVINKTSIVASSSSSSESSDASDTSSGALSTSDDEDDSDYESVPWSEGSEMEDEEPGCDLFVACAWNGVTYLIDWSKKLDSDTNQDTIKYQLVKFAFEGRVCAFTAGLYSVENHVNVPCLFYVDFEDQIYVYYDVRISPGPVTGFIDLIDDDIEEALDRIMGIENGIESQLKKKPSAGGGGPATTAAATAANEEDGARIDLGDGWEGIADGLDDEDDDIIGDTSAHPHALDDESQDTDPSNLADFIHECLYGFHDMKDRLENQVLQFEQSRLSNRLPPGADARRLSDLNITIEPPSLEVTTEEKQPNVVAEQVDDTIGLYPTNSNISEESSESFDHNDNHIASWIEGSLINSSIFKQEDSSDDDLDRDDTSTSS